MKTLLVIPALLVQVVAANALCFTNKNICDQQEFESSIIQELDNQTALNKWSEQRRIDYIRRSQGLLPRSQAAAQDVLRRQAEWVARCKPQIVTDADGTKHRTYAAPGCESGPK